MDIKHKFVSPVPHNGDPRLVQGPYWNEGHNLLVGPERLVGRSDSVAGEAQATEIALDPNTMAFANGKLTARMNSSEGPDLWYFGTDDWEIDTPAIQAMLDSASALNTVLRLKGNIRLGWSAVPDFYEYSVPQLPVHLAVKITTSNIRIDGEQAIIRFAEPPPLPPEEVTRATGSAKFKYKPVFVGFGTFDHIEPRTLVNIEIYNCTVDYTYPVGCTVFGNIRGFGFLGCGNVRFYNNKFGNPLRPLPGCTIADDGAGNVIVTCPAHGLDLGDLDIISVVSFSGNIHSTMLLGTEYFVRARTPDTFKISRIDNGPLVASEGPSVVTVSDATVAMMGTGFGVWVNNLDDAWFDSNSFRYMKQGYYVNYCRNAHWSNEEFIQMVEPIDVQDTLERGSFVNCRFLRGWSEAQGLDLACVRSVLIANNIFDWMRTPYQIYTKTLSAGSYERSSKYGRAFVIYFSAGTPGLVHMPVTFQGYNGMRLWFEYIPPPEVLDEPPVRFPGESAPGAGDGDIKKYTTYIVTGWNAANATFSLLLEGTHVPPTPTGTAIPFTNNGSPDCIMTVLPDSPLDTLPSYDVTCIGNIATNLISELPDPDPDAGPFDIDAYATVPILQSRVCMVGTVRDLQSGIDRGQHENGIPIMCQKIRFYNNTFQGGRAFLVEECEDLDIDGLWLFGMNPGVDGGGAPLPALSLMPTFGTAEETAQGALTGNVRNVHIIDCQAKAFTVAGTGDLTFEDIEVRGYNLLEYPAITGGQFLRTSLKPGHKQIGRITMRGGVLAPAGNGTDLDVRDATTGPSGVTRVSFTGPLTLASTGYRKLLCDLGLFVADREQVTISPLNSTLFAASGTSVKFPLLRNTMTPRRFLIATITPMDPIVGNGTNFTRLRISKVDSAGVVANVSSSLEFDSVAVAAQADVSFVISVSGTNAAPDIGVGDTVFLHVERRGTGSILPYLILRYYAVPWTDA